MEDKKSTVLVFFINGINCLLGWNAVLAALDYFANRFQDFNIYSFLSVPLFAGYLLIGVSYHMISNKWKYSTLIVAGNTIVGIALISLFLVSIIFQNTLLGFILLLICSFFIGVGANSAQLTYFAMINYLSQDAVSKFTVGTAVSGLFMIIVRIILIAIFGTDDNESFYPILIYFIIAVVFNIGDTIMNVRFCKSEVYKHKIDHFLLHHDKQKQPDSESDKQDQSQKSIIELQQEPQKAKKEDEDEQPLSDKYLREQERIQSQNYFLTLKETCLSILPYPLVIMGTYVVTFTLFPGPVFSKPFNSDQIDGTWSVIILNLCYNIGDTTGKYGAEMKGAFNHKSLIYTFFARFIFIFTITFMAMNSDSGDTLTDNIYFPFINALLFGVTNGFYASFILSFQVCPLIYKKYAGVLCGLLLQVGIIIGTIIEIPYSYIFGISQ